MLILQKKKNIPGTGNLINNTWLETLQIQSVEPTTFILLKESSINGPL